MISKQFFTNLLLIPFLCLVLWACAHTSKKQVVYEMLYDTLARSNCSNDQGKYNCESYPPPPVDSFENYQKQRQELLNSSQK